MRTTLILDDDLVARAQKEVGVSEKTALVRMALESLLRERAYQRLAGLRGRLKKAKAPPRRRKL